MLFMERQYKMFHGASNRAVQWNPLGLNLKIDAFFIHV